MNLRTYRNLTENQRNDVCCNQKLSVSFIRSVWEDLTEYQKERVCYNQKLSESFIESAGLSDRQRQLATDLRESYPTKQERIKRAKEYAKTRGLKIKDRYLYAFRNHDRWNRGDYSRVCRYDKVGVLYEDWRCDPRKNVGDSYGFGIWPGGNTPVRVPLHRFVVSVDRDDGKARVEAFERI